MIFLVKSFVGLSFCGKTSELPLTAYDTNCGLDENCLIKSSIACFVLGGNGTPLCFSKDFFLAGMLGPK